MSIDKTIQSVSDKLGEVMSTMGTLANTMIDIGLVFKIEAELYKDETIAGIGIRHAIECNKPCSEVLSTCADMIEDGWQGLSLELSEKITTHIKNQKL